MPVAFAVTADSTGVSAGMAGGTPVTPLVNRLILSAPGVGSTCLGVEGINTVALPFVSRAAELPLLTQIWGRYKRKQRMPGTAEGMPHPLP